MKKNINPIIALLALCFCMLSACTDDLAGGWTASDGAVSMKITLNLPASSSAQTRADADADGLEAERRMDVDGMHILVFENDVLKEDIKEKELGAEVNGKRILTAKSAETYKNTINVVILANMNKNGINFDSNDYINKTKAELYGALKYAYGDKAWDVVGDEKQYIPMWGAFKLTPSSGDNKVSVSLYRAVSKINVLVGNGGGLENFTLTSVRVYYANKEGYAAPFVEPSGTDAVKSPSIRDGIMQSNVKYPLIYKEEGGTKALKDRIYLPESNNKELAVEKKPLCLVVGGKYEDAGLVENGEESFYRIDFKDTDGVYDALRNHLYIFDINSVSSPGTTTPEEALDKAVVGMKVTIESWNDTYMNGLTSQYSLVTDKSRASFAQKGGDITITVSSDYTEPWKVVDVMGEWFKHDVSGNKIILTTTANYGASRIGSFCIQAGQLKKQIFVDQAQPGTANCYLVGTGEYGMSVVVKGNGTSGLTAESKGGGTVELEKSATLEPAYLSVIWETEKGLITLVDAVSGAEVTEKAYYDKTTGMLKYRVKNNPKANDGKLDGGNALIGAFNETHEVIWSWHIWVCPEMLASNDEEWGLTGYKVMDRNLGALSNKPGEKTDVGSLGLLYQWGRKDPFIGAAQISNNSPVMPTVNYLSHNWEVAGTDKDSKTVAFTIKNPTKLIHDGLSKGDKGAFLWGTDAGLAEVGIKHLGKKTIYDPCPIGYRVPPVDAFVFKGTTKYSPGPWNTGTSVLRPFSEDDVVSEEIGRGRSYGSAGVSQEQTRKGPIWISIGDDDEKEVKEGEEIKIPKDSSYVIAHKALITTLKKSSETKNWDENLVYIPNNLSVFANMIWSSTDYLYEPDKGAVLGAKHYGYYLNYNEISVPKMAGTNDYELASDQPYLTWLPLSGAYDPTKGFSFSGVTIEEGSSLTVNSFIWTNSSVKSTDGIIRPGALFLHGANPNKPIDGRHIHALNRDDIKAEPHYAGAVRCVRDEKKDFAEENKVPTGVSFGGDINAVFKSAVFAINESWRVIDPGAPWVRITPDRGAADKGRGTEVTFTAAKANDGSAPRTTIMKIQIGDKVHDVSIEQKAN